MDLELQDVIREVAMQLCGLGTEVSAIRSENSPSLIFPSKRSAGTETTSAVRVSEAEARLLFALALSRRSVPFAIEVPTTQLYSFKGSTAMSARIDLVAYAPDAAIPGNLYRHLDVEFKAHNAPPESIRKDLEKLLREGQDGLWFHVLQNIDSRTLHALLAKFHAGLEALGSVRGASNRQLTIAMVVLGKRLLLFRTIDVQTDSSRALGFEYVVRRGRVKVLNPNGWCVEDL
jgi:hypothetical protein